MTDRSKSWHGPDAGEDPPSFVFRRDLKVVFENTEDGGKAEIKVVDPTNSKQFSFTEQEYFLCLAADGRTPLAEVARDYKQRFGREMSQRDLSSFYRRLKILGLVEAGGAREPHDTSGPPRRAAPDDAGRRGPFAAVEAADGLEAAQDFPAAGARMGAGFGGGMGGGMGDEGFGRGGAFAGGAGQGPNLDRLRAMIAAKRNGGDPMAVFAQMAGAQSDGAHAKPGQPGVPASLHLFDPTALFRALYIIGYPLKLALWLIVPATLVAVLTVLHRWGDFVTDFHALTASLLVVTKLLVATVTVNLVSRLAQGIAITSAGGAVPSLGIRLLFGVIPRFYIKTAGIRRLDRKGQLWAHGTALLARLALFALGIIGWAMVRDSGGWLADSLLLIGQIGFVAFAITAFPLVPSDGAKWLATYYGDPNLAQKAQAVLRARLGGRPLPQGIDRRDAGPLLLYAIGTILTLMTLTIGLFAFGALALEQEFGGLGVTISLGILMASLFWLAALQISGPKMPAGGQAPQATAAEFDAMPPPAAGAVHATTPDAEIDDDDSLVSKARVIWMTIAAILVAVAFVPYTYEAGGSVKILPSERSAAVARSSGEVVAVHVREGEQVAEGALLAEFSSWQQLSDISVTEALLAKAEADLAGLRAGAKPEEIELAQRRVESAEANTKFSAGEVDRQEQLLERGATTFRDREKAATTHEANLADLEVARAELELKRSGATAEELAKAEAEVRRLEFQLSYQKDELERTRIYAPIAGQVVTPNLNLLHGTYFDRGETFLHIENDDRVIAAIAVPEADVALLQPGAPVRLRAYTSSSQTFTGEVQSIAPTAEEEQYGRVVRVEAVFENSDSLLRSDMTGYAKIEGAEMRVWEAFLRRLMRFFQIEVWSWVP